MADVQVWRVPCAHAEEPRIPTNPILTKSEADREKFYRMVSLHDYDALMLKLEDREKRLEFAANGLAVVERRRDELKEERDAALEKAAALESDIEAGSERYINLQRKLHSITTERDQAKYGEQDLQNQLDSALGRLGEILSRLIERDNGYDRCVICRHQTFMGQEIVHDTDCPLDNEPKHAEWCALYTADPAAGKECDCAVETHARICDECEHPVDSEPHLQHCPEAIRG